MNQHHERNFDLALIDIDGTLCRGRELIPGAPAFIRRLRARDIRPVFFTNNATRTPEQVKDMLVNMGIEVNLPEICTAAQAAAGYIRSQSAAGTKVAFVGVDGLKSALASEGLEPISVHDKTFHEVMTETQAAVVGLDQSVTYQELALFCQQVVRIGRFVLTNPDVRLPVEGTFMPGNGAIGSFVRTATGLKPVVTGKPEPLFVDYAIRRYGGTKDKTFIVGDNLLTDIAAGVRSGVYTVFVESGVTYDDAAKEIALSSARPHETYASVEFLFKD